MCPECWAVFIVLGFTAFTLAAAQAPGDSSASSDVKLSVVYDGAAFANSKGGVSTGSTYTSNLNLQLDVDLAGLVGWPGTIVYLDGLWLQGGLPSTLVGDAQGVSNISAPNSLKLYEGWIQKNFSHNQASVLAGLYDLNSEFYRLQSAGLFLNSFVWNGTGVLPEWRGRTFGFPGYGARCPHRPQTRRRHRHPHGGARRRTSGSTEWQSRCFRERRRFADRDRGRFPGSTRAGGATAETAIPDWKAGDAGRVRHEVSDRWLVLHGSI